jgi:spore coat-associated protein N
MLRSPTVATCLLGALIIALTLGSVGVQGAGQPPAAELRLASGTLSLSNSLDGAAVLSAQNLKPGDSRTGLVTILNTGTLDGSFNLAQANLVDSPGPFGGRLSDGLQLSVEQISAGGSTVSSVYSGALSGLGLRPLGTLAAGEPRIFRFITSLPDGGHPPAPGLGDNVFQSSSAQVDYVWTATADAGGGGNGGGVGNGGGWPSGQPPFTLKLSGKKRHRPLRKRPLKVGSWCSADCRLTWSVKVRRAERAKKRSRRARMVTVRVGTLRSRRSLAVPAGQQRTLKIKFTRRAKRALRRQLRKRRRIVAVVTVTATSGGTKVRATRKVALKR